MINLAYLAALYEPFSIVESPFWWWFSLCSDYISYCIFLVHFVDETQDIQYLFEARVHLGSGLP